MYATIHETILGVISTLNIKLGVGVGGVLTPLALPWIRQKCAPKSNRMEIVLGIKVVFTNTFNNSMTERKELNKTVNIIHF